MVLLHTLLHSFTSNWFCHYGDMPRVGSGVEKIDLLHFLAGCRKRRLNKALSALSLSLGFFLSVLVVLLTKATFCVVICVFCTLVVLVRLSVPVQVIDWNDSSLK